MNYRHISLLLGAALFTIAQPAAAQQRARRAPPNPAFAKVTDDPSLPRVLLIGDSISIGYTLPTRELLAGKANVHRIATNGGPTTNGVANLDKWLGEGKEAKWDVIHFNFGLHDLKHIDGKRQVSLEEYEKNLRQIVARLKKTGAKLIWATTTPVPEGDLNPPRSDADVVRYNQAAHAIMEEQGVAIDDLYAFVKPRLKELQRPVNVHFTDDGSKALARQVAASILKALEHK
jgi:acyl-CoA thioesterase-1